MIDGRRGLAFGRLSREGVPMIRCHHCGWTPDAGHDCPRCGARLAPVTLPALPREADDAADWLTVARFGNAAEAGYFADELHQLLGCEPRIDVRDDFDAIHACWHTRYSLSLPAALADHARAQLNLMLDGEWDQLEAAGRSRSADRNPFGILAADERPVVSTVPSGVNWVPIMLTLAAGSLVIWAGNKKAHPPRRPPAPRDGQRLDLIDVLSRDSTPWVQHLGRGGVRELVVDGATGAAQVREDADGDGVYEREFAVGRLEN
jgi:hypothetical protein